MGMCDDQLKSLLEWFAHESETNKAFAEERRKAYEKNHEWIQPDLIQRMPDDELEQLFMEYYDSDAGGKGKLVPIYKYQIIRDIQRFRETLMYILDEGINIRERINSVLNGERKIRGFGRAIVTSLLMDFNLNKYCLWNKKTESGFKVLGWTLHDKRGSHGADYENVIKAHQQLKNLKPDLNLTFLETDLFLHTIAAEEEGRKMVEALTIKKPEYNNYWQIAPGENARLWEELRDDSLAAVEFPELDLDLSGMTEAELLDLFKKKCPGFSNEKIKIHSNQLWNFMNLKPGDRFVTNKGKSRLLALGVVKSGYKFRPERKEYKHTVDVDYYRVSENEIPIPNEFKGKFGKTIVPLTRSEFETLEQLFPDNRPPIQPRYSLTDFVRETGILEEQIKQWQRITLRKKHIIFQGPPGMGKTFLAQRLARFLVSEKRGLVEIVQFHPAYAYEDFVQGIRPEVTDSKLNYTLMAGRFKEFCGRSEFTEDPCIIIIDEINRGNLARVFGELMYLLEYRDQEIPLSAGGEPFKIPENVYIIGTMNTADRSIALVDHALRRRFSFIRLKPDYEVLKKHLESKEHPADGLISVLKEINKAINDPNYEIGISFFMRDDNKLREHLPDIWMGEIEPYLEEFFYDPPDKVKPFRWATLLEGKLSEWV